LKNHEKLERGRIAHAACVAKNNRLETARQAKEEEDARLQRVQVVSKSSGDVLLDILSLFSKSR
jgi:hypothetical protein